MTLKQVSHCSLKNINQKIELLKQNLKTPSNVPKKYNDLFTFIRQQEIALELAVDVLKMLSEYVKNNNTCSHKGCDKINDHMEEL